MYSILLVDDETKIRTGIKNNYPWEQMGFQIRWEAADGAEALEILEKCVPDVILTDIVMHGMSGIELAKHVHDRMLPVKIVFLSGYRDFEYARYALSFNVFCYILKPIDSNELISAFKALADTLKHSGTENETHALNSQPGVYDSLISDVKLYIGVNLSTASLQGAAEHASISMSHLSRIFKSYCGVSFSEYLTSVRMKRAKELMRDRKRMIYEIAEAVGYESSKNFTRAFKKYYGITPQEYRYTSQ